MLWGDPVRKSDGGGRAVGWCVRLRCLEASFTYLSLSPTGGFRFRRDALENEREARAHIESSTGDDHGLVHLLAMSVGQLLSLLRGTSDVRELGHRNL